jgi:glucose-6-phosphate dehydrogenase assembly protein OpcA
MTDLSTLLAGSKEVPFSELENMLASGRAAAEVRQRSAPRAFTATVVVVGTPARLAAAVEALGQLGDASGVRALLISEGTESTPVVRMTESFFAIDGLAPRYLDNAVAAVRLPSLPALIWWRGGSEQALIGLTTLADRLVLDTEDPERVWSHAGQMLDQTALTDLRWTRLTRWRGVLAHLFDLEQVRGAIDTFRRVAIETSDRPTGRLFAAWLMSSLEWHDVAIDITIVETDGRSALESVRLSGERLSITVHRLPGRDCLEASVEGEVVDARISPMGHATLSDCINEELTVRSRDIAFERALAALGDLPA